MPPSSSRRVGLRSRRDPDPHQQSDADTPDSIATPTRKRRRLNGSDRNAPATMATEDIPRTRITESVVSNDSNATLPNGAEFERPSDPVERQNLIIQSLRTASYTPNAAVDYSNDLQARKTGGNDIPAYAKIAAREWSFFVQKTILLIGRADSSVRPHPPTSVDMAAGLPQGDDAVAQWGVDIDLGPERQVSRVHAQIDFDSKEQTWFISVNSRNGLKLDDMTLHKGNRVPLHSGICICILGTQMLFLLATQEDQFHPMLWRQVKNDRDGDGDSDKEGNNPSRSLQHAHPGGPTPKRENYDPFPPSSHPRSKQYSQTHSAQLTSTPGPQPGTPLAFRSSEKDLRTKGSPLTYPRGMMLDSVENVDYSQDSAKDIKPPYSYAQLIGQAILSTQEEMLTLANIYQYIKDRYAFFRYTNAGWQNSIRHNLSLNKSFEKVARRTDEPGKGMKWKIADNERDEFVKKQLLNPRKSGGQVRLSSSGPNSPAMRDPPSQATERLMGVLSQSDGFGKHEARVKTPPRSATPPVTSYPMANESYTPDRGPRPQNSFGGFKQSPSQRDSTRFATPAKRLFQDATGPSASTSHQSSETLVDYRPGDNTISSPNIDQSKPNMGGLREQSANSPPPLFSDSAANAANSVARGGLVTPLVTRHAPRLAPPSTAQVPSQYMNFSSPAPFWKFVELPSTPAKGQMDLSPTKLQKEDGDKDRENESVQPSSPPLINDEDPSGEAEDNEGDEHEDANDKEEDSAPDSPTRTLSRPVSRANIPGTGLQRSRSNTNINGFGPAATSGGMVRGTSLGSFEEEPEEEGFDLAKGFQKIGSFHHSIAKAHGVVGQPSQPPSARTSVTTNM